MTGYTRLSRAAALERLRSALAPSRQESRITPPGSIGRRLRAAKQTALRIATIDLDRDPWWLYFRRRK
ncbi:MAG: hypothetical protein U0573_05350 [Phycisphaerales bacterium]|nr:hypothetical protein [Planctomycetota bacterium]